MFDAVCLKYKIKNILYVFIFTGSVYGIQIEKNTDMWKVVMKHNIYNVIISTEKSTFQQHCDKFRLSSEDGSILLVF